MGCRDDFCSPVSYFLSKSWWSFVVWSLRYLQCHWSLHEIAMKNTAQRNMITIGACAYIFVYIIYSKCNFFLALESMTAGNIFISYFSLDVRSRQRALGQNVRCQTNLPRRARRQCEQVFTADVVTRIRREQLIPNMALSSTYTHRQPYASDYTTALLPAIAGLDVWLATRFCKKDNCWGVFHEKLQSATHTVCLLCIWQWQSSRSPPIASVVVLWSYLKLWTLPPQDEHRTEWTVTSCGDDCTPIKCTFGTIQFWGGLYKTKCWAAEIHSVAAFFVALSC